jgi:hypothetical protein
MYRRIASALLLGYTAAAWQSSFATPSQGSSAPASQASPQKPAEQESQTAVPPPAERKKTKKVWTNDDLGGASGSAISEAGNEQNNPAAKSPTVKPSTAQQAAAFRKQLAALQAQLASVEKQIADLKSFNKGETPGANGLQMHKAYTMEPIENQLQKLEEKRKSLAEQIDGVFDAARKRGIEPGQLR